MHTVWRAKTLPTVSPFGMKLETYLRMANIPYELETKDALGPKGRLPWITYRGEHVADTHLIIQYLSKKFSVNLNKQSSDEQVGAASACRIMLEEHFVWAIIRYRFIDNPSILPQIIKLPRILKFLIPLQSRQLKQRMEAQGLGLHSDDEFYQMTEDDLRRASAILGSNKFFGGEEPCEDDAAVFSVISQGVWGMPGSSCERILHGELTNLKEYCVRMKELYWGDWESCLDRSKP